MDRFTHLTKQGEAVMVDVGGKQPTHRRAVAQGQIHMSESCYRALQSGDVQKGDVMGAARVAGIMACKKTAELIPLCHPLMLTKAEVDFVWQDEQHTLAVTCTVECQGQTGVEMEALTGVSVALLTVYDMCKAIDKQMVIGEICLLEKQGGKSGSFARQEHD